VEGTGEANRVRSDLPLRQIGPSAEATLIPDKRKGEIHYVENQPSHPGRGRKMYRFGVCIGGNANINIAGEGEHCDCTLAFLSIGKSRARRSVQERKKGCPDV